MTEIQIKAGDHLLKIMKENKGMSTADDYPDSLRKAGFTEIDVRMMILSMEESGFIETMKNNTTMLRLTNKGYSAEHLGLENYFKKIEKEKKLEQEALKATVQNAKWTKISIIIVGAIGTAGLILSIWNTLQQP